MSINAISWISIYFTLNVFYYVASFGVFNVGKRISDNCVDKDYYDRCIATLKHPSTMKDCILWGAIDFLFIILSALIFGLESREEI